MTITADTTTIPDQLRGLVEATATALASQPAAGVIHPGATTALEPGTATTVSVRTSAHAFTIDEPAALGGDNLGANPVEHLLASLGSCQVITYRIWAAKLGVAIDTIEVDVTGELDIHGFFGLDDSVRPGFQSISVDVRLGGPETVEAYADLTRIVEEHCPVLDVLTAGVPVTASYRYDRT